MTKLTTQKKGRLTPKRREHIIHAKKAEDILEIKGLKVEAEGKKIIKGIDLEIKSGEIHVIMGPNGSGKSTLCKALMGHPAYKITQGSINLNGKNIVDMPPNKRAHLGIFLGFQHPTEIPGIGMGNFLRLAKNANTKAMNRNAVGMRPMEFCKIMEKNIESLKIDPKFMKRSINKGFSGGEKKRTEIIQMAILEPKIVLLDEIDSGLDIDALKIVAKNILKNHEKTGNGILMITHYQRILDYIEPDHIHIMVNGRIVKSGDGELARELEKSGYKEYLN